MLEGVSSYGKKIEQDMGRWPCGWADNSIKWDGWDELHWEEEMTPELEGAKRVSHLEKDVSVQRQYVTQEHAWLMEE